MNKPQTATLINGNAKFPVSRLQLLYQILFGVLVFQLLWISKLSAQSTIPMDEQYKKRPTNAMAAIASGDADKAIENLENYLADYPNDAESHYCMAVAYSVMNDIPAALNHVKKALASGMPAERFIVGPRDLLKNLAESEAFTELVSGSYMRLVHGPMLGDVTSTGAKIWLRTDKEANVLVTVYEKGQQQGKKYEGRTALTADYTTIIQVSGLQPSMKYRYTVHIDGVQMFDNGIFETTEEQGERVRIKIGFGGGAGYTPWFERMWDTLATQSFDAFLLLGDNVYIDYPTLPMVQEYCYYRRQSRPEFRRFTPNVPIYAIWDDHDFTVNDGEGGPEIETPSWKRPVWNTFKNQWANPYYAGGKEHPGCWFDFSIGDIDFFMLDCRYYRENPKEVDAPSMLGEYQKAWLKEKLAASMATFKVIASSVPWAINTKPGSDDTWDGFPKEREEIFSFISENNIAGVLLISADRHRSDAWKVDLPNGYTSYDLMSSKLTNIHTHDLMEGSLFGYNKKCSFGTLEFDTTAEDPTVSYTIKSIDNEEIHKLTIFKSQLDFDPDKVRNKKGRK
jgi:alkaline phosphatase D